MICVFRSLKCATALLVKRNYVTRTVSLCVVAHAIVLSIYTVVTYFSCVRNPSPVILTRFLELTGGCSFFLYDVK